MSEREWIHKYIRPLVQAEGADALRDDVAILSAGADDIVTMDTLVEGRHFLTTDPLNTVGQKLIRVNVSDIYSKGAAPREALLSVAWPDGRSEADFAALMAGIAEDLKTYSVSLIGGDTVTTQGPLVLSLTLTGKCLGDAPVRRMGRCSAGATLWVSGPIGFGAVGLREALANGDAMKIESYRVPPISNLNHAKAVAQFGQAAMDVSDGLLLDSLTLAEMNGRGVAIELDKIWLVEPTDDLNHILTQVTGGDDYQILMVAKTGVERPGAGFMPIGTLTDEPGLHVTWKGEPVNLPETLGFEHR